MEESTKNERPSRSGTISELAKAMAQAQALIGSAHKDKENTFFHSKYADLSSVWDACRVPLSKNGLSVLQRTFMEDGTILLETILFHSSGEWISSILEVNPVKNDPQGVGSALTYARRYSLSSLVGVSPFDDDGEGAMNRPPGQQKRPPRNNHTMQPPLSISANKDGKSTAPQHKAIQTLVNKVYEGAPDNVQHAGVAGMLGLEELKSYKDLTFEQASKAIKLLSEEAGKECGN